MPLIEPFHTLCTPAKIHLVYLVVMTIACITSMPLLHSAVGFVIGLVWSWILNWICRRGYAWVSWIFAVFPIITSLPILAEKSIAVYRKMNAAKK
jgi:H+/Cl- antiporter ClcA